MIPPYSGPEVVSIGPFSFHVFGILVATGVVVGHSVVMRLAAERRVSMEEMRTAAAWALGAGFLGAHVFDVVLYHPERLVNEGPIVLLAVWDGISSYGGFLGALIGLTLYFAHRRRSWWTQADLLLQGLVVGWFFGRLGCTLTSDHLGHLSDFALAFAYSDGARHNVGFYEFLYTALVLIPAIVWVRTRERSRGYAPGVYVVTTVALYAPARFVLDFLRATDIAMPDPRWLGLTGAQYVSIVLFALAIALMPRLKTGRSPLQAS